MTIQGEQIDRVQVNAYKLQDETYIGRIKEALLIKHHGRIEKFEKAPCFCVFVPTEKNF